MLPTLMFLGFVFGYIYGVTRRVNVTIAGAILAVLGLWLLVFTVGEIDFTIAIFIVTGLLAVINYLVGGLLGWGIERLVRVFFRR
ncbi:MAG: hypothetical protein BMS9Abin12_0310 [Acidimicrobiia bacterium]|nr:MAG: hypothetical protein BMS9Abin12_0310 [Acidimicrobiia bacterium]